MRYTDDAASASDASSGSSRARTSHQPSYVDRFRPNAAYAQPTAASTASTSSSIPQLLTLIDRAVRPTLRKPDLATNLQIADIINEKKGTAPREAATAIVGYINKSSATSVLAMSVLDVCVKNCGYPFHLQISRKEFLNNLVKRFPEKPPLRYSHTQTLILEAIQEWKETICRTSKHKADFGFIRDMHRLLQYKGYVFPQINREDAAVLNENETLKTAADLEAEDREVQSAKLHELLHSGQPKDLEEANRIMKVLAGFKEQGTDYKLQAAKKLDETRQKGEILEEMLNSVNQGDSIDKNDVFGELASSLRSALPQIRKVGEAEQEEDPDAYQRCVQLYNYIEALVQKYDLVASGNVSGAQQVPISSMASGNLKNANTQSLIDSLIDIDGDFAPQQNQSNSTQPSSGDLLGLDFGGLTLGGGSESATPAPPASSSSTGAGASTSDFDFFGSPAPAASGPASGATSGAATPSGTGSLDIFGGLSAPSTAGSNRASPVAPAPDDSATKTAASDDTVVLKFAASRTIDTVVTAYITNPSTKKISNIRLEIASTRSRPVNMAAASGSHIDSGSGSVTQSCTFPGTDPVKFRWRLSFKSGISVVNLNGQEVL